MAVIGLTLASCSMCRAQTGQGLPFESKTGSDPLSLTLVISSGVVCMMKTIPPPDIGAVCIIIDGKAPIPYGKSYS